MTSGISVCTASTMSRSDVAGPRFGATPVRIQALRFWYISPRVPSIGSTMMRQVAACSSIVSGKAPLPARHPFGNEHERLLALRGRGEPFDDLLADGVDRVDGVALLIPIHCGKRSIACRSVAATTASRTR